MKKVMTLGMLLVMLMTLALTACGPTANAGQENVNEEDLPPVAVVKAREALAAELGVPVAEVAFGPYERAEWTDSCLGLGGPAESCLTAIYPGWLVMLEVDGTEYEVRTDELGDIIRIKS